ncbi:exodeoxyribonuclease III [Agarilytica rhodophyticola]|uniref:exodeoxyribonuclease III n=1 Tax=Agarilytica rhodophyticola TaxID=1737490 RepID=UPI000B3446DB|nr:exodeoxyribonuclease III [Agarilytica rhodophyticola]
MKCVSFNVNSIRTRMHQLEEVVNKYQPDFIGLQETKVSDEDFPLQQIQELGYHVYYFGQKTHYGVALLSKVPAKKHIKGFANDDENSQRRFIGADFELADGKILTVLNGYFPQGESREHPTKFPNKQHFYQSLIQHLNEHHTNDAALIAMGDMNISPSDKDIGIGEDNRKRWLKAGKSSFLPEEREWFEQLMDWGLEDTYRLHYPDNSDTFSWFDYRSKGFDREPKRGLRIDFVLATQALAAKCTGAGIDYDIRSMERPSDHCPVWASFDLSLLQQ